MSYHLSEITAEAYGAWYARHHQLLRHCSPFHHPAWLAASAEGVGFKDVYLGIHKGRQMVGAMPGYLARRGPIRLFGSPLRGTMTSYLGPTGLDLKVQPGQLVELVRQCNRFVRQRWRVHYARFTLRNAPAEGKLEMPPNWKQQRAGSYRLSLSPSEEALWKGLKSDCRRNIRKARQAGIEVVPLRDPELFYQMLDDTFRRHQTTSFHSGRFFRLLLERLVPADCLWPWSATYNEQEIAVGLFLHDNREVHFISGASLPEHGNLPTSYLLHWQAIINGVSHGLQVFNSDASRIRSIDRFKESFRPTLERRYTLIWAPDYVYRAQKQAIAGYRYLRRFQAWLKSGPG